MTHGKTNELNQNNIIKHVQNKVWVELTLSMESWFLSEVGVFQPFMPLMSSTLSSCQLHKAFSLFHHLSLYICCWFIFLSKGIKLCYSTHPKHGNDGSGDERESLWSLPILVS